MFLPSKFVDLWSGESQIYVSEPLPAFLIPYCRLGFLMQHISMCSSEHTCPLVFWENRVLSKNLLCKTYRKCWTCSFLFNLTVICTVHNACEPQIPMADPLCRAVNRWMMQSSHPMKDLFLLLNVFAIAFLRFLTGAYIRKTEVWGSFWAHGLICLFVCMRLNTQSLKWLESPKVKDIKT